MRRTARLAMVIVLIVPVLILANSLLGMMLLHDGIIPAWAQQASTNSERIDGLDSEAKIDAVWNNSRSQMAILNEISLTSTKLATQSAYTAMSVFFLGISLVIFGLKLTSRSMAHIGKYMTLMIWALTVPVIALVSLYQIGAITGYRIDLAQSSEPFFVLSFLMYVPIGIVVFLLLAQQRINRRQAAGASQEGEDKLIVRLQQITTLREQGTISDSEFQKLKARILPGISGDEDSGSRISRDIFGSEQGA